MAEVLTRQLDTTEHPIGYKPDEFEAIIDRLKVGEYDHGDYLVTEYYGGPVTVDGVHPAWVSPIDVHGADGRTTSFHVISRGARKAIPGTRAELLIVDEMDLKLGVEGNPAVDKYTSFIERPEGSEGIAAVVRPVYVGINRYPHISASQAGNIPEIQQRALQISRALGYDLVDSAHLSHRRRGAMEPRMIAPGIAIIGMRNYQTRYGEVVVSDVSMDDAWGIYQIISTGELPAMPRPNRPMPLRIDSGCDTGQVYRDGACECREQLELGIELAVRNGGVIIHVPTQDGRGYGGVTKLETEGLKQGLPMIFNADDESPTPVDTIAAAQRVFGEIIDIRTYTGVGRLLSALGIRDVELVTNNRVKLEAVRRAGVTVNRTPAHVNKPSCAAHVEAKKQYDDVYLQD